MAEATAEAIIWIQAFATGEAVNAWLVEFDPEANDGRGHVDWTENRAEAKRFPDSAAAMEFWNQQSRTRPTRPDGKPNKPLTAFTVEICPAEVTHARF